MPVLVTGATGLVGNNVVRELLGRGEAVRVLVRKSSDPHPLEGLDVDVAHGDVQDAESVRRACAGVSAVIHSAAVVHIGWSGWEQQRAVNVEGTRHMTAAALAAGARLVHVSSVDTLGLGRRNQPADEETPRAGQILCPYVVTKGESEAVVQQQIAQGLDAVIVHPGFMLGPWDWKPSSGRMLLQIAHGFAPLAPIGGGMLCDVRDVASGILAAREHGQCGRNYILGGHNMTYQDMWRLFAEVTGGKPPWFCAGPFMRFLGGWGGDTWGKLTGHEPDVNSASVAMSSQFHCYHSMRAHTELGYTLRPARETVEVAWQWFLEHGVRLTRTAPATQLM